MSLPEIDTHLFLLINRDMQNAVFDTAMPFISRHARFLFLPFAIWLLLKEGKRGWALIITAIFSIALADGSGHLLKDLFARPRPCHTLQDINLLMNCGKSFSMPSNHASNAFAFAMVFWFSQKNMVRYFLIFLAALVGMSRISVGVHYPSDVIAGGMLGAGAAYISILFQKWAYSIYERKSYRDALFFILFIISLFRIYHILTGPFDLSPDEAHYWEWSRRPDWSYYSKGPMIACLISAGTAVLGNTVLGIRIIAVILSALSSIILFRLGKDLFDERTGFVSALLILIVPLYSAYGLLMTIDSPFIFFWTLSLMLFHKAVTAQLSLQPGKTYQKYWITLGISTGLGLLTKYTMAFFCLSGLLFLLFSIERRKLLATVWPYLSFVISMIIFSPVILWNAAQGWVTFKHTAGQAHLSDGLVLSSKYFFEFLGSQFAVITPVLLIMILIALWKLKDSREGSFLFWFSIPVIAFFVFKSVQGKVQANWALTGYETGFIAFSAFYIKGFEQLGKAQKILVGAALCISLAVTSIAHFPSLLNLPQHKDPTVRLAGWKELGKEADRIHNEMSLSGPAFIFSDNYQVSSQLAFYMKARPVTYCANLGRRMNQYDLWPGFRGLIGQNAMFVKKHEKDIPDIIKDAFKRCDHEVVQITTRGKRNVKFTIGRCYDFKGIKSAPMEKF